MKLTIKPSFQLYPTPSLNYSFYLHNIADGTNGSSGVSNAFLKMYFSIGFSKKFVILYLGSIY